MRDVDVDSGVVRAFVVVAAADAVAAVAAAFDLAAVDVVNDASVGIILFVGSSVGEVIARVVVGFGLIGATFAVIPNFETADRVLVDVVVLLPNRGTVSRDDVVDFCDVYEANLICYPKQGGIKKKY